MGTPNLFADLTAAVPGDVLASPNRNFDGLRFARGLARYALPVVRAANWCGRQVGLAVSPRRTLAAAADQFRAMADLADGLQATYVALTDDESRRLMRAVLRFRALGPAHVRLPTNTPAHWRALDRVRREADRGPSPFRAALLGSPLRRYDLSPFGVRATVHSHLLSIQPTVSLNQYAYQRDGVSVAPAAGDTLLDGGGCWGDTAVYFADRVGPSGRVVSFEFDPTNLAVFRRNLEDNPELADRITVVPHPLWDVADRPLGFAPNGPATRVGDEPAAETVRTTTIDETVGRLGLTAVNFIKLDVEGAELAALRGGEATLRRFRPKLAVAVYHRLEDFAVIPAYLQGLDLGYSFHLGHYTIHAEETMLFARP